MSFVLLTFTSRHFGCGLALLDWLLVLFLVIWLGFLCLAVGIDWVSCQILASRPDEKLVSVNWPDRWIALCWPGNNSTARTFINVEVLRSDNAFVTESWTTDAGKKKVQQQWINKSCQHGEHCTMFHILLWEHRHCLFSEGMEQHMQRSVYRFTTEFTNTHTLSWFLSMHIPRYVGLWQHMQSQIERKKSCSFVFGDMNSMSVASPSEKPSPHRGTSHDRRETGIHGLRANIVISGQAFITYARRFRFCSF